MNRAQRRQAAREEARALPKAARPAFLEALKRRERWEAQTARAARSGLHIARSQLILPEEKP